jgi:hypothetical protein
MLFMIDPEIVIVPMVFGIPSFVIIARMWFKHKEKMATLSGHPESNPALDARLSRIEEAVETIAIEMERMGEGQRFVTKLLAERTGQLADGQKNAGTGRVTTPH